MPANGRWHLIRCLKFKPFCFNIPCPYAPRLNLRTLFRGLTPFGWLRSIQGVGVWVWAPEKKKKKSDPPSKGENKETRQRALYARWPLAASAVNTTNYYLLTFDTKEKDKNIAIKSGPGTLSGPAVTGNLYRLPHSLVDTGSIRLVLTYSIIS